MLFSEFMREALYGREGFYSSGRGQPGRRGDFITSPDVGPLFGLVTAKALSSWWAEMGSPKVFDVFEVGAGTGQLARSIQRAMPFVDTACAAAMQYVTVELGPYAPSGSLRELPVGPINGVVLCNELLDNLPFDLVADGRVLHVEEPWPDSGLAPLQSAAFEFVDAAVASLGHGRFVAIDYCGDEFTQRPWKEWLRTYRHHERGTHPLEAQGTQDITCEVDVAQLPPPSSNQSQAEFLQAHGIDELVAEGRQVWADRAHIGDVQAVMGRSRITEAEALCDPTGLGAFRVLDWVLG